MIQPIEPIIWSVVKPGGINMYIHCTRSWLECVMSLVRAYILYVATDFAEGNNNKIWAKMFLS